MPTITVSPNGINGGMGGGNKAPSERGELKGWSAGSARRNMRFLQSVETDELNGVGIAFTLTVRDCPVSHDEWSTMRDSFVKFLQRRKLIRLHWVTEWQKRGAPHFHMSAYFPDEYLRENPSFIVDVMHHWYELSKHLGTLPRGQHYAVIDGGVGWQKYVSKHASRGYAHYQREEGSIPKGWEKTGRLWGKSGKWPTDEVKLLLDDKTYFRFRRLVRRYRVSDAQGERIKAELYQDAKKSRKARQRVSYARRMLKRNDRNKSEVRGVSEWVPATISKAMINHLAVTYPSRISRMVDGRPVRST